MEHPLVVGFFTRAHPRSQNSDCQREHPSRAATVSHVSITVPEPPCSASAAVSTGGMTRCCRAAGYQLRPRTR
eukprot:COSAG03_NODE_20887_length_312_cov_0.727700_1_plen_72_part_01